jgi:hypothetical protein
LLARTGLRGRRPARLQIGMRSLALHGSGQAIASVDLEEPGLAPVCAAAGGLLGQHAELPVQVRLACGWSRILLLPWMAALAREDHWRNYATARFEENFGEEAAAWEIRIARDLPGHARVAVAWPRPLYETLGAHRGVVSARVGLLEHLGVLLAQAPRFSGCVIELDDDGAGFLLLVEGKLQRVRWRRYDGAQGLASAVHAEWASVLAARDDPTGIEPALAVTPPALVARSERGAAIKELGARLGVREGYSLPD